jgi:DNA-directed RNA polymerase subunit L
MADDRAKGAPDEVTIQMRRAGLKPDEALHKSLTKALVEIEEAGKQVRKGIQRNDEPASAFHAPFEKSPEKK